jgi:hypothetical protein
MPQTAAGLEGLLSISTLTELLNFGIRTRGLHHFMPAACSFVLPVSGHNGIPLCCYPSGAVLCHDAGYPPAVRPWCCGQGLHRPC